MNRYRMLLVYWYNRAYNHFDVCHIAAIQYEVSLEGIARGIGEGRGGEEEGKRFRHKFILDTCIKRKMNDKCRH